jgi:hypothetical protein
MTTPRTPHSGFIHRTGRPRGTNRLPPAVAEAKDRHPALLDHEQQALNQAAGALAGVLAADTGAPRSLRTR